LTHKPSLVYRPIERTYDIVRTHLDIHFTSPLAAPGAAASRCVSIASSLERDKSAGATRMPVIAFGGVIAGAPNHPYALARRPMR
jgi:hypothetical protein